MIPEGYCVWKHGDAFQKEHRLYMAKQEAPKRGVSEQQFLREYDWIDWVHIRADGTPRSLEERCAAAKTDLAIWLATPDPMASP